MDMQPKTTLVGRQPIFDRKVQVCAYEILFRTDDAIDRSFVDGDVATGSVVLQSLTDIGLDALVGDNLAFINLTRNLLLSGELSCLPPNRVVLEILEDIKPDYEILQAIERLSGEGYTIALDDFVFSPSLEPLVRLADIVKVELPATPVAELPRHIDALRTMGVDKILAEKVETHEEFDAIVDLGFDLFQGYFFCRPQVLSHPTTHTAIAPLVNLLGLLHDTDSTAEQIERAIQSDSNLSYRLLRLLKGADVSISSPIDSIRHAISIIGLRRLKSLAAMMLLSTVGADKPPELVETGMIRGKLCEILAQDAGFERPDRFFTVGLFSVLDAMLDRTMHEVTEMLPLAPELNKALTDHEGELGAILSRAVRIETCNEAPPSGVYAQVVQWLARRDCPT